MEKGSGAIYGISQSEVNEFLKAPGAIGGTTPAAGTFTPLKAKGPATITTFAGTVSTAGASTTITWSSAADAILAGYDATNPTLGTTIITGAIKQASVTRYVASWTNATACVVDTACTLAAATELTSVQLPIAQFIDSSGVVKGWMNAAGVSYFVGNVGFGTTLPGAKLEVKQSVSNQGLKLTQTSNGYSSDIYMDDSVAYGLMTFYAGNYLFSGGAVNIYSVFQAGIYGSSYALRTSPSQTTWGTQISAHTNTAGMAGQDALRITATSDGNPYTGKYLNIIDSSTNSLFVVNSSGNVGIGTTDGFGTSAAKVLSLGAGTAPTTSPADVAQMWVADYLGGAGDARLHIMGEGSAAAKTVLGSGKVGITGTTGGLTRQLSEAVSAALSGASGSIAVNVPSGARILGVQLRVDTAITSDNATKTWAATYANTPTTAITTGQVFGANTKFNAIHPAYEITTGTVTITITAAAGLFTGGVVRAICYYESIDAMASL